MDNVHRRENKMLSSGIWHHTVSRRPPHVSEAHFVFIFVVQKCLVYSHERDSRCHSTAIYGVIFQTVIHIDNTPKSQIICDDGHHYMSTTCKLLILVGSTLQCTVLTPVCGRWRAPVPRTDSIHPIITLLFTILTPTHLSPSNPSPTISELLFDKHTLSKCWSGSVKEETGCENK
jgi:hypothetical protein